MPLVLPQLPQKAGTHLTEQWEPLNASSSAFCPSQTPFILMLPDCELAGCFTPSLAAGRGKAHSTSVLPREAAGERYQEKNKIISLFSRQGEQASGPETSLARGRHLTLLQGKTPGSGSQNKVPIAQPGELPGSC